MVRHGTFIELVTISKQVFHSHQHNAVQSQGSIRKVRELLFTQIFFSCRIFFYDAVNYELCVLMM